MTILSVKSVAFVFALLALPAAHAGTPPTPIDEPGSWALVGIALVAAIVAKARNKRK